MVAVGILILTFVQSQNVEKDFKLNFQKKKYKKMKDPKSKVLYSN
jgi:hypothetical protein